MKVAPVYVSHLTKKVLALIMVIALFVKKGKKQPVVNQVVFVIQMDRMPFVTTMVVSPVVKTKK
jgi:hypothetical protein